jgi:hypothetical protein
MLALLVQKNKYGAPGKQVKHVNICVSGREAPVSGPANQNSAVSIKAIISLYLGPKTLTEGQIYREGLFQHPLRSVKLLDLFVNTDS